MSFLLYVDVDKCKELEGCKVICETTCPGFKTVYGGIVKITDINYEDEVIRAAANGLRDSCPNKALKIKWVSDAIRSSL